MTNEVTGFGRTEQEALTNLEEAASKYACGREYNLTPGSPQKLEEDESGIMYEGTVELR